MSQFRSWKKSKDLLRINSINNSLLDGTDSERITVSRLLNRLAIPRLPGQYSRGERGKVLRGARSLISFGGEASAHYNHGFQRPHSNRIAKKRLFPRSGEGIYKAAWENNPQKVHTTTRRRPGVTVGHVSNWHSGREDEADFRNAISKVHNTDTVLIGAVTCIGYQSGADRSFTPVSSFTSMHHCSSPSFPFPPFGPSAPSSPPHAISPQGTQGCLHPLTASSVGVYSGTNLLCRAESVVKLSTPDRTNPDASSSKTQRTDADQARRAYDPKPAATREALRHERAARRGQPCHGATSGAYMFHLAALAE